MSMNQLIKELPGLVAWYPHVAGSGSTLYDYSGNSNNGTINGATWRKNVNGFYTLDYDGANDYVSVPDSSSLDISSSLSVCFWVRSENTSSFKDFITRAGSASASATWSSDTYSWAIRHSNSGEIQGGVVISGSDTRCNSGINMTTNTWYHVAMTYDGSNIRIYVNGSLENTTAASGTIEQTAASLWIGAGAEADGTTPTFVIDGQLSNLMIADEVWSPELVKQIYRKTYIQ